MQQAHPYADTVNRAVFQKALNASLIAQRVFYTCERFRPSKQRVVQQPVRKIIFNGKLNSVYAMCVALDTAPPSGLQGKMIGYECSDEPDEPKRGLVTGAHRGDWGVLSGDVFCVILMPFVTAS